MTKSKTDEFLHLLMENNDKKLGKIYCVHEWEKMIDFTTLYLGIIYYFNSNIYNILGYMYLKGLGGLKKNYVMAFNYFGRGAELGNKFAENNYALMYLEGLGIKKDPEKALHYFERSAEYGGYADAYNNLAKMYRGKSGIKAHKKKEFYYREMAAKRGCNEAMNSIGCIYYMERKYQEAYSYFEKCISNGYPPAQHNMGCMHQFGKGVEKNSQLAFFYYALAHQNGFNQNEEYMRYVVKNWNNLKYYIAEFRNKLDVLKEKNGKLKDKLRKIRKSTNFVGGLKSDIDFDILIIKN